MAQTRMLGVVLWCDEAHSRAVIWCEDQGDLAHFPPRTCDPHTGDDIVAGNVGSVAGIDAGDLIQFDLTENNTVRFACNPQVLCETAFPTIAQSLMHAAPDASPETRSGATRRPAPANSDSIIEFSKIQRVRQRATA